MNTRRIHQLSEALGARDEQILTSLERFRLLDTHQLQRLHFANAHATTLAAARACNRTLRRLDDLGVITSLERRIGGVRRGSASYVWQLASLGERYLRAVHGRARRKRYLEPGAQFVTHTLAVNDLAVSLAEANRDLPGFTLN
ncbi:replication-relaxation family protein [Nocardioides sp. CBS4Y-1]|uniref:Replication-relaxation family protein n=1 Tax=Nocardioides acrostichi TaxID=2784339 RepID=A0A930Y8W1_9ACTN|nr:replication-relaxation family protein [Nocardioides acrostichi]MBF4163522.1 replication-relaxation family protein [Nocardioides acrostichi]